MFIDEDDYEAKIEAILEWGEENPWFDTGFIQMMQDRVDKGKELTNNMIYAIDNIFEKTVVKEKSK